MDFVHDTFAERVREIDQYLDFLQMVEDQMRSGSSLANNGVKITTTQQKVLCASVYLHLYNLVESTISLCISAVEEAASKDDLYKANDLSDDMRREWLRSMSKSDLDLNPEGRLNSMVSLCEHLVSMLPIKLEIVTGGGGNWDDERIFDFTKRIGLQLNLSASGNRAAKRPVRDDMGPLKLVKSLRNKLAHGEISFGDCGDGATVSDLRSIKEDTVFYLNEVVRDFEDFVRKEKFLTESRRQGSA